MSVNMGKRRNVGILLALLAGTVLALAGGVMWLRGRGEPLIVEVAYGSLVLVVALFVYDGVLVE